MNISETEVYKTMESWAVWRHFAYNHKGGGGSVLGRVLDGMPSTRCTNCQGACRVKAADYARTKHYTVCTLCGGKGKIKPESTSDKINPAFIHSTSDGDCDDNPIFEYIDYLATFTSNHLDFPRRQVIAVEFCDSVTGPYKFKASRVRLPAKRQQRKDGISIRYYKLLLRTALEIIEVKLIDRGWLKVKQLSKQLVE